MPLQELGAFIDGRFKEMKEIHEKGLGNLTSQQVKDFQTRNEELSEARARFMILMADLKDTYTKQQASKYGTPKFNNIIPKSHHEACAVWTQKGQEGLAPCDCGFISMAGQPQQKFNMGVDPADGVSKGTLWGIPVVEDPSMPEGKIALITPKFASESKYDFLKKPPVSLGDMFANQNQGLPGQKKKSWNICEGDTNCAAEGTLLAKLKGIPGSHEDGRLLICSTCFAAATANGLIEGTFIPGSKPVVAAPKSTPAPKPAEKPAPAAKAYEPKKRKFGLED